MPSFEVFVLTYNRKDFLSQAVDSLLKQTVQDFDITIFDNASNDGTDDIVKKIIDQNPNRRIVFKKAPQNNGSLGNFKWAQELASKDYVMLFHDDDILHPKYIETVYALLDRYPDTDLISSANITTSNPDDKKWKKIKGRYYVLDKALFAAYLISFKAFTYPSVVYKTSNLKQVVPEVDIYGKIADRQIVMDTVQSGAALMLADKFIQYRIHAGQDSKTLQTGPFEYQIIALLKKYQSQMKGLTFPAWQRFYNFFMVQTMQSNWRQALKNTLSFADFVLHCKAAAIVSEEQKIQMKKSVFFKLKRLFFKKFRFFMFRQYRRKLS